MRRAPRIAAAALLLASLFITGHARAEPPPAQQPQVLASGDILRGRFVLDRRLAGFAKPLTSEGSFSLIPGRGLIWRAEKPFEDTTVITSAGISVRANGEETMRLPASRLPGIGRLYDILGDAVSGNIEPLRQDFAVSRSSDSQGWHLLLTPNRREIPAMSGIGRLTISGRRFVDSVDIERTNGDADHVSFLDQTEQSGQPTPEENALLAASHK